MSDVTVLVSSAGRRGALISALREAGPIVGLSVRIIASDQSPLTSAGRLADELHVVPPIREPTFVEALLELAEREGVDLIVPTIDTELPVLAAARPQFLAIGSDVLISSPQAIEICSDKRNSSRWLRDLGMEVPYQHDLDHLSDVPQDSWPLFFKPSQGSSSVGAQIVANPAEVAVARRQYGSAVIEELASGPEYTIDCWVNADGVCRAAVPRLRIATRAGEIAKGMTRSEPVLEKEASRIAEALPGARGPITIQAIVTDSGPRYIEVNPRFGGGYPLSHKAGAWYTAALVAETVGKPVDQSWFEWQQDLLMLRYDEAVFVPRWQVEEGAC